MKGLGNLEKFLNDFDKYLNNNPANQTIIMNTVQGFIQQKEISDALDIINDLIGNNQNYDIEGIFIFPEEALEILSVSDYQNKEFMALFLKTINVAAYKNFVMQSISPQVLFKTLESVNSEQISLRLQRVDDQYLDIRFTDSMYIGFVGNLVNIYEKYIILQHDNQKSFNKEEYKKVKSELETLQNSIKKTIISLDNHVLEKINNV